MKNKFKWIVGLLVIIGIGLFAQIPGKNFGFTENQYWTNSGIFKTDNQIISTGTSNGFKVEYAPGISFVLTANSSGNLVMTGAVVKHAYDAAAYYTITQADAGGVTFNSTSDGTAGFTFSDPITLSSLTASKPVFSDGSKILVSGTASMPTTATTTGNALIADGTDWVSANILSAVPTGLTYTTATRAVSLTAGYTIPTTTSVAPVNVVYWIPGTQTLQALITSLSGTAANPCTIIIPPGYYEAVALGTTPLLVKPWVNLMGFGGRGRMTVFHNIGISLLDAAMGSGTNRFRMDGIRLETCPVIMTAASHVMSVVLDDCPINNASSIKFTGTSYASRSALELRNLNIDQNTSANLYKFCNVSFWNCTLLGLYFEDADAYLFGCDISATCNAVNAGVAGGWFEFNHCKIDQMVVGDPTSESVLATFGVGGSENIQVHGCFTGQTAPASVGAFIRMRAGTQYFCHADGKLYIKTGDVGTNTWAAQT